MSRREPTQNQRERVFTITSLTQQKKRPWRTSIFINGEFWRAFDTEIIADLGLFKGQKLIEDELNRLDQELDKRRAVNHAVLLLSYRARSTHEIADRLFQAGFSPETASLAIEKLEELGYLDDESFAQSWIKSRMNSKLYGSKRIKQELKLKGIADEIISAKLEENVSVDNEYERARELAESKLSSYKDLDRAVSFRRLSQFLLRRGYSPAIAYEICKSVL